MEDDLPQRKGGKVRAEILPPERRSEIARMAAEKRWGTKLPVAEHEGNLVIGETVLPSAVLGDKRRVLISRAILTALGRPWKGTYKRTERPNFIEANNLSPFVSKDLEDVLEPIEYLNTRGQRVLGYRAELLPLVCETYLMAREAGALNARQKPVAKQAEILLRGLSKVGIIGLVDEATGYQQVRERDDLQKIISAYVSPVYLPITERIPIEFFKEMFRVWDWPWPADELTWKGPLGPRYGGKLMRQVIYENLPQGVLEELDRRNPPNKKWQRRRRMQELLTSEIGRPHVEKLIANITMLFRLSDNKAEFWRHYRRAFNKEPPQLELNLTIIGSDA
jgi:hypothetical protein